jgi:hypothetical protein
LAGSSVAAAARVDLALVLLVGAGLLTRSFTRVLRVDPGVKPEGVFTGSLALPAKKFPTEEAQRLARRTRSRSRAIVAGVVTAVHDAELSSRATGIIYIPFDQSPQSRMTLAATSALPFEQVMPAVRRQIAAFDKQLPLSNQATLAIAAAVVPTLRATRVNPATTMRAD